MTLFCGPLYFKWTTVGVCILFLAVYSLLYKYYLAVQVMMLHTMKERNLSEEIIIENAILPFRPMLFRKKHYRNLSCSKNAKIKSLKIASC